MREHEVQAADGTVLRAWRYGRGEHAVLGVATIPELWPALPAAEAQIQLHSWRPRGGMGSPGAEAITVEDHVADAIAVLDAAGVRRCVVAGWSLGVSIGAALALRHPDRVSGLLMMAGVPGGWPRLPAPIRSALAGAVTRVRRVGPLLTPVLTPLLTPVLTPLLGPVLGTVLARLPVSPATVWPLRHSGLMLPAADPSDTARAADRVLRHHWAWLLRLALTVATGPAQDLRGLRCPVTVLAGRHDLITDVRQVAAGLAGVPQARMRILPTSHFVPLEAPQVVLDEIRALQHRAAAVETAVRAVHGDPLTNGLRRGT